MAGQIAELAHRTLRKDYRRIDPQQERVVLLEGAPTVLGTFGEHLAAKATKTLERLGVEVQLGAVVVDIDEYGIDVKDSDGSTRRIASRTKVWAAGVAASPLARHLANQAVCRSTALAGYPWRTTAHCRGSRRSSSSAT